MYNLEDVINFIEQKQGVKLYDYQKKMLQALIEGKTFNIPQQYNRKEIIKWYCNYIRSLNGKNIDGSLVDINITLDDIKRENIDESKIKKKYNKKILFGETVSSYGKSKKWNTKNIYKTWRGMFQRCYSLQYHEERPTYKDCKVCEEWHDFQSFIDWYDINYYEIEEQQICLDKDILFKYNKIYSPERCIFVPHTINLFFIKSDSRRGTLPIGVCAVKNSNKFKATIGDGKGKQKHLGFYNTSDEAFNAYKNAKEDMAKQIIIPYQDLIPKDIYGKLKEAINDYEVDIWD